VFAGLPLQSSIKGLKTNITHDSGFERLNREYAGIRMRGDRRTMEAARRLFAAELDATTCAEDTGGELSVLTPSGARCSRLYLVGACTEVLLEGSHSVRARVADPTGVFRVRAGGEYPAAVEVLGGLHPPAFVAITGSIRRIRCEREPCFGIRAETCSIVDRMSRDAWVVRTAELMIARLERLASCLDGPEWDTLTQTLVSHYRIDREALRTLSSPVREALATVPEHPDPHPPLLDPRQIVREIIASHSDSRGIPVTDVHDRGIRSGLRGETIRNLLSEMIREGECYAPQNGYIKLL
jgi:RPA family protein